MKNQNLPKELQALFGNFNGTYYKGYWEIVSSELDQTDQYENTPQIKDNRLTIILHTKNRNSNTWYYFFKIESEKVELNMLGWRGNGIDIWTKNIPYGKAKINKVLKWLNEKMKEVEE